MNRFFLILFLFSLQNLISQKSSDQFDFISNDLTSDSLKEVNYVNLIKSHYRNKDFNTLFNDVYILMRWYNKKKQYEKAISLNRWNIFLMDSLGLNNTQFYRQNNYSIAFYLRKNNESKKAIKYYEKVLEYNIVDKYALFSSFECGLYFFNNEDFYRAIDYFKNTIDLSKRLNNIDYETDATMYSAVCYRLINNNENINNAIELLENQISNEKKNFVKGKTFLQGYYGALASLHRHLGTTYADKNEREFNNALYNFEEALSYTNKLKEPYRSPRLYTIYHDIGNLYAIENDTIAFDYFDKALKFSSDEFGLNQLYNNKANLYKRLFQFENAKENIQLALRSLSSNISDDYNVKNKVEDFLDSNERYLAIETLINKAEIFIEEAKFNKIKSKELNLKALEVLKVTENVLDIVRLENIEFKTKLFWRNKATRLYTNAIKVCFLLQDYDQAFYYMEKNKALLLLEDVLLEGQNNTADIPEEIRVTHEQLRKEVIKYESDKDSLLRYKLIAKANYNRFLDSLDSKYKIYFKSIKPAEIISLDSFQNNIKNSKHAYIEYILGEKEGFGMLITKDKVDLFTIPDVDSLRTEISELKLLLKAPIATYADKDAYNSLSYSIYSTLFPEQVKTNIIDKSLTIIPDDVLHNIPFEALQTSTSDNDYLIFKHQISYANSLTFLSQNKNTKRENTKNAIGFAPIHFTTDLPPLENSITELKQLNLFKDAELFVENNATKQNLFKNLNDYKLVHISTHASNDKFREPYLALNDSLVNINELYLTKNTADLVVLSACETANGDLYKGEGVLSLSRSFFNTGAKSVASTLWSIDDKSSSELMASFYSNLNKGDSKSEALHEAKLDYLKSHSLSERSPYYWASFVLVGDTSPIDFYQDYTIYYVIIGLSLLFSIIFFLWKRRKSYIN